MKVVVMIVMLLFFVLPVGGFVLLLMKLIKNTKKDAWEGEVVDKLYNEKRDMDSNKLEKYYSVVFKTVDGRQRKMAVTPEDYKNWKPGDKVKKEKGKMYPVRI